MTFGQYARQEWAKINSEEIVDSPPWKYYATRKVKYDEYLFRMAYLFVPFMNDQLGWSFKPFFHHYGAKKAFSFLDWPKYEMDGKYSKILKSLRGRDLEDRDEFVESWRKSYIAQVKDKPWFHFTAKELGIPQELINDAKESTLRHNE